MRSYLPFCYTEEIYSAINLLFLLFFILFAILFFSFNLSNDYEFEPFYCAAILTSLLRPIQMHCYVVEQIMFFFYDVVFMSIEHCLLFCVAFFLTFYIRFYAKWNQLTFLMSTFVYLFLNCRTTKTKRTTTK